jgi:hypothetical protein
MKEGDRANLMSKKSNEEQMEEVVMVRPIQQKRMVIGIEGVSPLVVHRWSEKAKKMMRDKQQNKGGTKLREAKDPEQEYEESMYRFGNGRHGFPAGALKGAMMMAAHKDVGFAKTAFAKAVFVVPDDADSNLIEIHCEGGPKMREDMVRIGLGSADMRYRAEYTRWSMILTIDYDAELIGPETLINLLQRAGFGVGLGEGRPSSPKHSVLGWGRFQVQEEV